VYRYPEGIANGVFFGKTKVLEKSPKVVERCFLGETATLSATLGDLYFDAGTRGLARKLIRFHAVDDGTDIQVP